MIKDFREDYRKILSKLSKVFPGYHYIISNQVNLKETVLNRLQNDIFLNCISST
jgi:hypothetical protein